MDDQGRGRSERDERAANDDSASEAREGSEERLEVVELSDEELGTSAGGNCAYLQRRPTV